MANLFAAGVDCREYKLHFMVLSWTVVLVYLEAEASLTSKEKKASVSKETPTKQG